MRRIIKTTLGVLIISSSSYGQQSPALERFTLEGALTIGNSDTPLPPKGTIRWNSNKDFERYNGRQWLSFTSNSKRFGIVYPYRYENEIIVAQDGMSNENFGEDVAIENDYWAVGTPEDNNDAGSVYFYEGGDLRQLIEVEGSTEFGERVDMSDKWLAIGTGGGNAYVYNALSEDLEELKPKVPTDYTEFIAIDKNLLAVKAVDSTLHTYFLNGNNWEEFGQISAKEIAIGNFDISEAGLIVANELGQNHILTFEFNSGAWTVTNTLPSPNGFSMGAPAIYGNTMAVSYNWIAPFPAPAGHIKPEQAFLKIFEFRSNSWTEIKKIEIPNTYFLGSAKIHGNSIIVGSDVTGDNSEQVLHNGQGKVHVIVQEINNWNFKYSLTSSDGRAGDIFGSDYDIDKNTIIVGALWADLFINTGVESNSQGKTYIFKK